MRGITSLGFRTDVALRVLEGAEVTDRGDYLVVRSPDNPDFWWGNFLLLAGWPAPGTADSWLARFAAEFPLARYVTLGVDSAGEDIGVDGAAWTVLAWTVLAWTVFTTTGSYPRSSWPRGWSRSATPC